MRETGTWTDVDTQGYVKVSPPKVRASDQVVFWASLLMSHKIRAATYPADFDTHGEVRYTRFPMDPPMIVEAHGLYWLPVWKGSYILAGSWWLAMGWMMNKAVQRTTAALPIPREWSFGLVLSPPEAVQAAGWALQIKVHSIAAELPIGIPGGLIQAAKMHQTGLNFHFNPNAQSWVILVAATEGA